MTSAPRRNRRLPPSIVWVLIGMVVMICGLGGIGVIAAGIQLAGDSNRLSGLAAKYRQTGLPWTASDLNGSVVPDADNAAFDLRPVILMRDTDGFDKAIRPIMATARAGNGRAALASLATYKELLNSLEAASRKPKLDFQRNYDYGVYTGYPEFACIKRAARLISIRAMARASLGDFDGTADDLEILRRVSNLLEQDHSLLACLVSISIDAIRQRCGESIAILRENPTGLTVVSTELQRPIRARDFDRVASDEAYVDVATGRNYFVLLGEKESDGVVPPSKDLLRNGLPTNVLSRSAMASVLEYWIAAEPVLSNQKLTMVDKAKLLDKLSDKPNQNPFLTQITDPFMPTFTPVSYAIERENADQECVRALYAASIYRAKTRKWPDSLDQLSGKFIDPFTGGPLHMKLIKNQFRVYSLGPDRVDHGGLAPSERQKPRDDRPSFDSVYGSPPVPRETRPSSSPAVPSK